MRDEVKRNEVKLLAYQATDEAKQLERVVLKVLGKWSMSGHDKELANMKDLLDQLREAAQTGRQHLQAFDNLMESRQRVAEDMGRHDAAYTG